MDRSPDIDDVMDNAMIDIDEVAARWSPMIDRPRDREPMVVEHRRAGERAAVHNRTTWAGPS